MVNKRARAFDYRDERGLVFDEDLEVLACDRPSCGELRLGGVRTERVNRVLERLRLERKQAAARHFVDTAEREFPDVPLEMLLEGFAREPRLALALVKSTGRLPPQLDAVMVRRHGAGWGRKG